MVKLEDMPDILIVNEVARYLRVSVYTVEDLIKLKMLAGFRFLGRTRIRKTALIEFIKKQENFSDFKVLDIVQPMSLDFFSEI